MTTSPIDSDAPRTQSRPSEEKNLGLFRRMQFLQEWERAYLTQQRQTSHARTVEESYREISGAGRYALVNDRSALMDTVPPIAASGKAVYGGASAASNGAYGPTVVSDTGGVGQSVPEPVAVGIASAALRRPSSGGVRGSEPREASQCIDRMPTLQQVAVCIVQGEDGVRIWLRDAGATRLPGMLLITQLRGLFDALGMRLCTIVINGQLIWNGTIRDNSTGGVPSNRADERFEALY